MYKILLQIEQHYTVLQADKDNTTLLGVTLDGWFSALIGAVVALLSIFLSHMYNDYKENRATKTIVKGNIDELINNIENTIRNIEITINQFKPHNSVFSTVSPEKTFIQLFVELGYYKIIKAYSLRNNALVSRFWSSIISYHEETNEIPTIFVNFLEERNRIVADWNKIANEIITKVIFIESSFHGRKLDLNSGAYRFFQKITNLIKEYRLKSKDGILDPVETLFDPLTEILKDPDTLFYYQYHELPQQILFAKIIHNNLKQCNTSTVSLLNQKKENCKKYLQYIKEFRNKEIENAK